jgi:PAS domain S-box-containing protein
MHNFFIHNLKNPVPNIKNNTINIKNNTINIKDNILKQASLTVLIPVCFFVGIYMFGYFDTTIFIENLIYFLTIFIENTTIRQNNNLIFALIISFFVFGVCLLIFAIARYRDILLQIQITDKLKLDNKKTKSDMLLILDAIPGMVYYVDKNSHITWANKTLLKYDKDAIGKNTNAVFHEENLPNQHKIIQKSIETNKTEKEITYYPPNTLFSDKEAYYEHYCIPLVDLQNNISSLIVISVDITGKMQLEESKGRLNAVVESSQDAIFVIDKNSTIHSWNKAAEDIFGYSAKEIVGQPLTILDHFVDFGTLISISDSENTKPLKAAAIKHIELVKIKKFDSIFYASITVYPFVNDIGQEIGISAIVRDKTEAILAQEALIVSEKQMRKLAIHIDTVREEERKQIAFAIHDELGYALSAIKMDINWVRKGVDLSQNNLDERTEGMLKLVDIAIQKVKTIASNLRPAILDHFGLIAAIEEQAADFQRRTGIRCKVFVDPLDITVEEKLRTPIFRIFQEAQTNITRYAKASRVDVDISYIDGIFRMDVIDNGVGIPEEKINTHSSFGLLGIREKAFSIGGKATITGNTNEGTTVSLELPLKMDEKKQELQLQI